MCQKDKKITNNQITITKQINTKAFVMVALEIPKQVRNYTRYLVMLNSFQHLI